MGNERKKLDEIINSSIKLEEKISKIEKILGKKSEPLPVGYEEVHPSGKKGFLAK